ncbi:MAG TPA: hypothetical protein VK454_04605, partial [Myxococcaceae bacterium]|nr:hypothetical protein [Myxococcaceae bacterium]
MLERPRRPGADRLPSTDSVTLISRMRILAPFPRSRNILLRPVRRPAPRLLVLALSLASVRASAEQPAAPEVQACLLSLRDGERARAEAVLGPLDRLPFLEADLTVDPQNRDVQGTVSLTWTAGRTTRAVELRLTPNAFGRSLVRLHQPRVNGEPASLAAVAEDLVRIDLPRPVGAGERLRVELQIQARVPRGAGDG